MGLMVVVKKGNTNKESSGNKTKRSLRQYKKPIRFAWVKSKVQTLCFQNVCKPMNRLPEHYFLVFAFLVVLA